MKTQSELSRKLRTVFLPEIGQDKIRRTEVRQIFRRRAISDLQKLGRPATAAVYAVEIRNLHRAGLAVFAAFEREILQERTRAGLAHARESGKAWQP